MDCKRLSVLLIAAIMMITALVACGQTEAADPSATAPATASPITTSETTTQPEQTTATEATDSEADSVQAVTNVPEVRQRPTDTWNGYSLVPIYDNGMEYVWSLLSDNVKDNVAVMMNAMSNEQDRCNLVHPVSESEIWEFVHFVHDHLCGYTHVDFYNYGYWDDGNGNVIALQFVYLDNYGEAKAKNKELQKKIDEIVASAPDTSERERIKYFHDYVVKNCTYSYDGRNGTSYGALIDGKAVCQGYAHAIQMLLSRAGFDAVPAIGSVEGGYHKWNYVKLSSGEWYVIDATWDDPIGTPEGVVATYNYFMITDEQLEKDHSRRYGSRYFTMPEAK